MIVVELRFAALEGQKASLGDKTHGTCERCLDLVWHFKKVVFGRKRWKKREVFLLWVFAA